MKGTLSAVVVLLALFPACRPGGVDTDVAAIHVITERARQAFLAGEVDSYVDQSFFEDAVLMPPGEPVVEGKEAIRTWYTGSHGRITDLAIAIKETNVAGDWAYQWESWNGWLRLPESPDPTLFEADNLVIYRLSDEGRWLVSRMIWNMSAPSGEAAEVDRTGS